MGDRNGGRTWAETWGEVNIGREESNGEGSGLLWLRLVRRGWVNGRSEFRSESEIILKVRLGEEEGGTKVDEGWDGKEESREGVCVAVMERCITFKSSVNFEGLSGEEEGGRASGGSSPLSKLPSQLPPRHF